jgi:Na+-transporting NADH:ubiquinone oxidoreductase subunit NqrF
MKVAWNVLAAVVAASAALPAGAHHSFAAQYDASKPVTLQGVVTKVEWTNPHARFYINVAAADGKVVNWNLELASPNYLKRAGWSSSSLKEGDKVTVEGSLARSGANMANARLVTFADGTRVFARSAQDGG